MRAVEFLSIATILILSTPAAIPWAVEAYKLSKISAGEYRCCLESPCSYCLLKYGNCDCLDEVINGEVPCGECLGEIMEGEGNKLLKDRFPGIISRALSGNFHG